MLIMLSSLAVFFSCITSPFRILPKADYYKQVKTVILVEMEPTGDILPQPPKELESLKLTNEYRSSFSPLIQRTSKIYDETVSDIFSGCKLKLNVIKVPFNEVKPQVSIVSDTVRGITITRKYYSLNKEQIVELTKKYNADAIYLHQLYVLFDYLYYYPKAGKYVKLPSFSVRYDGIMYDKRGLVIFYKEDRDCNNQSFYKENSKFLTGLMKAVQIGHNVYAPELYPVDEIAKFSVFKKESIELNLGKTPKRTFDYAYGYLWDFWHFE